MAIICGGVAYAIKYTQPLRWWVSKECRNKYKSYIKDDKQGYNGDNE